ncbi:hypothetical protein M405DRAFT_807659 [Rhizopogon salebrosus TDB-379]|nr:hypothetical protein M405DRAFT_807659 [Rhizopogon salebrosus TDB-379]
MRRQVQEYKRANSIGWVGPIGYGNTSVVEIVGTRTPWDKDVPHPSMDTSLFQHWSEKAPKRLPCMRPHVLLQLAGEALLGFTTTNRMSMSAKSSLHFSYHHESTTHNSPFH